MKTFLTQVGFLLFGSGLAIMVKPDIFLYPATWAAAVNLPTQLTPEQTLSLGFGMLAMGSVVLGACLSEPKIVVDINKK